MDDLYKVKMISVFKGIIDSDSIPTKERFADIDMKSITSLSSKMIKKYNLFNEKGIWIDSSLFECINSIYYTYGIIGASNICEAINNKTFNVKDYSKVLENAISNGIKIYNDAYISCANKAFGYDRKHDNHLALLNKMFNEDKIQEKIVKCKTMEEAFNIIKSYPLIGNFMAYQLVTDINYSEIVNWREDEFTVAGPGSLRGIKKCFIDKGKMSNEDIIRYMYKHQEEEFKRLNLDFKKIGNRPLQLIDCQNIFCELDKYCRQALPDLKSNRTKIKKHYIPKKEIIEYIYPSKWKLNN